VSFLSHLHFPNLISFHFTPSPLLSFSLVAR
jgi:hypothetical protein